MMHVNGVINMTSTPVKTIKSLIKVSEEESFRIGSGPQKKWFTEFWEEKVSCSRRRMCLRACRFVMTHNMAMIRKQSLGLVIIV
jgi:hypothetical protein